jgi:hypothetical protein
MSTVNIVDGVHYIANYSKKYKYTLTQELQQSLLGTNFKAATIYFTFTPHYLNIHPGYSWDGASGPTWDTPDTMRASLIHDVFYQCFREKLIENTYRNRKYADKLFKLLLLKYGMGKFRANYFYLAVRVGGAFTSRGKPRK